MLKLTNIYENNLKNISLNIPLNKITSIIGVSGSGKSSLIYGVLANEAKRREKIDSGNATCLDYAIRAKFDKIENLPYCITLKQRGLRESISSTLATVTKLHELLREEFTSYGEIIGDSGNIIKEPNSSEIRGFIQKFYPKNSFEIFALLCDEKYTNGAKELKLLNKFKIREAIFISSFDNIERFKKVSTVKSLNEKYSHTILIPISNIDEIDKYSDLAIENFRIRDKNIDLKFNIDYFDINDGKIYQKKSSTLLSFNATSKLSGKCEYCNGHGKIEDIDLENLILRDKNLNDSFLNLEDNGKGCYKYVAICLDSLQRDLKKEKIDLNQPFYKLKPEQQQIIKDIIYPKILKHQGKPSIGKFVKTVICPNCNGSRLNYKANAVRLYGLNISEVLSKTVNELFEFLKDKKLHHKKTIDILKALQKATLGYLTLERTTDTLSGGEMQRLKFAIELNSEYKNLLYILDEPSNGLHAYNNYQMINLIKSLKAKGNSVIISEHNEEYIKNSDYVIELGIGSGKNGGEIIFSGEKKELKNQTYSRNKLKIDLDNSIKLIDININNIKNENFIIPLNCLVAISGVSGSGKSSLIHKVLVPEIKRYIDNKSIDLSIVKEIKNIEKIKSIIELTQSQIGLNSRSIVATYLNLFDDIRKIYTNIDMAKEFNFDKSYFSFNSNIGACETCKGLGEVDEIVCPNCLGNRYKHEVLEIKFKDLSIIELLDKTVDELTNIFHDKKLQFAVNILQKLGLSHISLGRKTPTLSGGEAQRVKLAKVLIESFKKVKKGDFIFIFDEPTTGLNSKDIVKLYEIFDEIISYKNSIIIIEHNLNIIKNSDFIIDIGLGSGKDGGKNLFSGILEDLLKHQTSLTAKALRGEFEKVDKLEIDKSNLKEKIHHNNKLPDCNKFYLDDRHFEIEKEFAKNYQVLTDEANHKYFKSKNELFDFCKTLNIDEISFTPYVSELFKYKTVPISIKKKKIKRLKKLGFKVDLKDYEKDEWHYRVICDDLEKAYNFGNGWISLKSANQTYEFFTRLVSVKHQIIGTPKIDERTFNLYLNSCNYCSGDAKKRVYDLELIINDKSKSILDSDFFKFKLKLNLKTTISKFAQEGLFDFSKPYNELSEDERNIFLFGFKEYKFLKPNGKKTTLGDYFEWKGLYFYIYDNLDKIKIAQNIKTSKRDVKCPFCVGIGIKSEVQYYKKI